MTEAWRLVGQEVRSVPDISVVDPVNPYWVPLWKDLDGQLTYLAGDVDGIRWEALVQADRVKIAPRKYETGWAQIIGLEAGFWATDSGRGHRSLATAQPTSFASMPHLELDLGAVLPRICHAATQGLARLERSRRYSTRIWSGIDPEIPTTQLSIDEQVVRVVHIYNEATASGVSAVREQIQLETGLPERTVTRRIQKARELGLIPGART